MTGASVLHFHISLPTLFAMLALEHNWPDDLSHFIEEMEILVALIDPLLLQIYLTNYNTIFQNPNNINLQVQPLKCKQTTFCHSSLNSMQITY
jgi:hypothetical protein